MERRSRVYRVRFGSDYTVEVILVGAGLAISASRECRHRYCTYLFTEEALELMKRAGEAGRCVVVVKSQGVPVKEVSCDRFAEAVEELNTEVE